VRRGFTGHEPDEALGLLNMRGRMYDPRLGRFLTPDPVVPGPQAGQAYNRYSYVLNDPLTYTDPSGFTPTLVTYGPGAGGWIGLGLSLLAVGLGLWLTPGQQGGSPRVGQGAPPPGAGNPGLPGMVQTAVQFAGAAWQLQQGVEAARRDMAVGMVSGLYETVQDPLYPFIMAAEAGYKGYQENGMLGAVNAFNPAYHAMAAGYQAMEAWERSDYYTAGYQGSVSATQATSTVLVAAGGAGYVQAAGASVAGTTSRLSSVLYQRWVNSVTPTLSLAPDVTRALALKCAAMFRTSMGRNRRPRATSAVIDRRSGAVSYGDSAQRTPAIHPELKSRMPDPSRTDWPADNCAEFQAVNGALLSGSTIEDLIVHTIRVADDSPFPRCLNCSTTTRGTLTTSD
jgi:RHS repeat-associated protein